MTLDDVLRLSADTGFRELQRQSMLHTPYTCDPQSMMGTCYHCEFWTMQKLRPPPPQPHHWPSHHNPAVAVTGAAGVAGGTEQC